MDNKNNQYFDYLTKRSKLGWLYRNFFLYPRLSRELIGSTLDIGCGIGDFLAYRKGTVGVDVNPRLVEYCLKRGLNASVMEVNKLPFPDATFSSLILDNVLEHIEEPMPLLKEMWRVMKPNGRLIVGVPGTRGYASDPDHKIFYSENLLCELFIPNGWNIKHIFSMPMKSAWLDKNMRQYCLYASFDRAS